jgi:hypothetical protein
VHRVPDAIFLFYLADSGHDFSSQSVETLIS